MSKALEVPKGLEPEIEDQAAIARSVTHSALGQTAEADLRAKLLKQLKNV